MLSLVVQVQMITVHCTLHCTATVHSFISIPPQSNIDIELYSTLGVIELRQIQAINLTCGYSRQDGIKVDIEQDIPVV